jgi:hypothetical protein
MAAATGKSCRSGRRPPVQAAGKSPGRAEWTVDPGSRRGRHCSSSRIIRAHSVASRRRAMHRGYPVRPAPARTRSAERDHTPSASTFGDPVHVQVHVKVHVDGELDAKQVSVRAIADSESPRSREAVASSRAMATCRARQRFGDPVHVQVHVQVHVKVHVKVHVEVHVDGELPPRAGLGVRRRGKCPWAAGASRTQPQKKNSDASADSPSGQCGALRRPTRPPAWPPLPPPA